MTDRSTSTPLARKGRLLARLEALAACPAATPGERANALLVARRLRAAGVRPPAPEPTQAELEAFYRDMKRAFDEVLARTDAAQARLDRRGDAVLDELRGLRSDVQEQARRRRRRRAIAEWLACAALGLIVFVLARWR